MQDELSRLLLLCVVMFTTSFIAGVIPFSFEKFTRAPEMVPYTPALLHQE